jgi:hypothetical protein
VIEPAVARVAGHPAWLAARAIGVSACLALAVLGAACGSSPSVGFADFDRELQSARCTRLARCQLFSDEASCEAYFRPAPDVSIAAAITAHKVGYDGGKAHDCIQQVAEQGCDPSVPAGRSPSVCAGVFAGSLPGGEACSLDAECASGTCEPRTDCPESGCCASTCRPVQSLAAGGGACAKDRDCQAGLICGQAQHCQKPAAAGADCSSDHECGDGLGCINPLSTMPGTCRALPHLGEACPYLRCAGENLRCDDAGTHTCVALGLPGAACAAAFECSPYLECNPTSHTCQALPTLGMNCTAACQGAAFCQLDATGAGTCAAPKANGAACESLHECASDYCFVGPVFDSCTDPPVCI